MCTPASNAYDLKEACPHADLRMVDGAGHMPFERKILEHIVRAENDFLAALTG